MKQELTWGTAAAVAIVAAVGITSQSGNKPATSQSSGRQAALIVTSKSPTNSALEKGVQPQCADSISLLEHFFLHEPITGPDSCYGVKPRATSPLDPKYHTEFVIATFPDPLHTHSSLLFDRFVESIQQGALDEGYFYDSSWLPWETEEPSLTLLQDQDEAEDRKEKRENQPGILLFRGSGQSPYQRALIVFVVGEEPTGGIHRPQFENAVAWIKALQQPTDKRTSVAILGPTSSGSFASLVDLLAKTDGVSSLNAGAGFSVYSGSTSSREDGELFAKTKGVHFRSFVQDDSAALGRLCRYFGATPLTPLNNLAILSEDETAYGYDAANQNFGSKEPLRELKRGKDASHLAGLNPADTNPVVCPGATNIYYPRDISALRAAYQTQSMFSSGSGQLAQDNVQRKSLPTDLADPAGQQHDTVRRYAGNQTILSQEAQLLGIVDVLRSHRVQYLIIRSSSTLDPLFLANFLRRDYPEVRIVIFNADLLFQRGQDAMALSGVMTLSTYPLFSWAREWTAIPLSDARQQQLIPDGHSVKVIPDVHSHRVFPENSTEGTYIASRLLLQSLARANGETPKLNCEFADKELPDQRKEVFVPALHCQTTSDTYAPLPDYAPPFWTEPNACDPSLTISSGLTCRPALWLSVITRNGTWPLAALNERTLAREPRLLSSDATENWIWPHPRTPRTARLLLVALCCLAAFQFLCCWFASFTAKPAFRAHFATGGRRHTGLVLIGSFLIALMTLLMAWGCGIFSAAPGLSAKSWQVWAVVVFVWLVTGAAIVTNIIVTRKLNGEVVNARDSGWRLTISLAIFTALTAAFFLFFVSPLQGALLPANRAFVFWRSMHLMSGVSPVVHFLSLAVGLYVWFWYALHGLALFGPDRPCLPPLATLGVEIPTPHRANDGEAKVLKLSMFSQENVAEPAERIAKPLAWDDVKMIVILFVFLEMLMFGIGHGVPVRNLGAPQGAIYSVLFCIGLGFYCSLVVAEGSKIWRTWSRAHQLLVFLDRMALRRTLSALHGFSWGTVWKMSGNVLDVRYKLLSRQLECLSHLQASLHLFKTPASADEQAAFAGIAECEESIKLSRGAGAKFAEWYSVNYNDPKAADLRDFQAFQKQIAETTGVVLTQLLVPASRMEKHSLIQVNPDDPREEDRNGPTPSKNELIRNAEELVCLTYLGFAQNLLGRIRTIVLGGVYLFIALSIAVSSYPFDPRTLLSGILLCLFVVFGGIVIFTYADMHRDVTLSHITNTKPGELGSEFWFKVIGYGAAPLLGLITQVFPEWSGFLFSWLQPGLSSLK